MAQTWAGEPSTSMKRVPRRAAAAVDGRAAAVDSAAGVDATAADPDSGASHAGKSVNRAVPRRGRSIDRPVSAPRAYRSIPNVTGPGNNSNGKQIRNGRILWPQDHTQLSKNARKNSPALKNSATRLLSVPSGRRVKPTPNLKSRLRKPPFFAPNIFPSRWISHLRQFAVLACLFRPIVSTP